MFPSRVTLTRQRRSRKTEVTNRMGRGELVQDGVTIEEVKEMVCLGQIVTFKTEGRKEILRRIKDDETTSGR